MLSKTKTFDRRLFTRRCVACGYDGALLRGGQAPRCARCNVDLRERPARSYAEMEGLLGHPMTLDPAPTSTYGPERLVHKWLAFLFLSLLFIMTLGFLAASVVEV